MVLDDLTASVASIEPAEADANVRLEGNEFIFSFKLPRGKDGANGTSSLGVTLTDESATIPCLDDGTPDEDLETPHASTRIVLSDSKGTITEGVTYDVSFPIGSCICTVDSYGDVDVTLTKESPNRIDIECKAIYNEIEYTKIYSISKAIGTPVYKVLPDITTIKQADASHPVTPSSLRVDVTKWNGKEWVNTLEKKVFCNYTLSNGTEVVGEEIGKDIYGNYTLDLSKYNIWKTISVYITSDNNSKSTVLDSQSLTIVKDGIGMFSSFCFTVLSVDQDISGYTVVGGNYNDVSPENLITTNQDGVPVDIIWTDTPGERKNSQVVWMISNTFSSADDLDSDNVWSSPVKMSDSESFQAEYSATNTTTPPKPIGLQELIDIFIVDKHVSFVDGKTTYLRKDLTSEVLEAEWRAYEKLNHGIEWSDTVEDPKWMATSNLKNGAWSDWTITAIKGEKGDQGEKGEDGKDGIDAIHVEISNEHVTIPTTDDGNSLIGNWDEDVNESGIQLAVFYTKLFVGSKEITDTLLIDWEAFGGLAYDGYTEGLGFKFILTSSISDLLDENEFIIQANYGGVSIIKTVKVVKSKGNPVYKLVPSASVFTKTVKADSETIFPEEITIGVSKWNGKTFQTVSPKAEGLTLSHTVIKNDDITENGIEVTLIKDNVTIDTETIGLVTGIEGESMFKSTVFKRSNDVPDVPTGGDYNNPLPDDRSWEDGIPEGTAILWASTRIFSNKNNNNEWSVPSQMTDTSDFDVEYSSELEPDPPTGHPNTNSQWKNTSVSDAIWMATSRCKNGVWEEWQVTKIKGEKGEDGTSPLHLELSNDFTMIPTDSKGNVSDSYWDEDTADEDKDLAVTVAQLYEGSTPVDAIYTWSYPDSVVRQGYESGAKFSVIRFTSDRATITCTADYNGFKATKEFKIAKSKGNTVYKLATSASLFNYDTNGIPTPEVITINVSKWTSGAFSIVDDLDAEQLLVNDTGKTSGGSISKIGPSLSPQTIYLVDKKSGLIIDQEIIGAVQDGKDGKDGADGKDGIDGLAGNSSFKSTVFIRTNTPPQTPRGGSYDNPYPDDDSWTDGIPSGNYILWASTRIFSSDGNYPQQSGWTTPMQMTDTSTVDIEYSSKQTPGAPVGHPNTNVNDWNNSVSESTIWMAISHCTNGVWSDWQVSKIRGEDGQDGTSIQIKGTYANLEEFKKDWWHSSTSKWISPANQSDCYIVDKNIYVWDGDSWVDGGPFKGADGNNAYVHIKYASEVTTDSTGYGVTGTFTSSDGEVPGKYIGIYTDENEQDSLDIKKYKWTQHQGEDGFGYEYIYQRNNSSTAPDVPTTITADDVAPSGWTDSPKGVTSTEMYEWVCYRKKISGVWTNWIGSASDNTKAALWAKWGEKGSKGDQGEKGTSILSVVKRYKVSNDGVNHPTFTTSDTTNPGTLTTDYATARYIWCWELTTYTDSSKNDAYYIVTVHGEPGATGPGGDAPMIYPAGIWNAYSSYIGTENKVPYVYWAGATQSSERYWLLKTGKVINASTDGTNLAPPDDTENWEQIESYNAVYSDIGLFNQALVGSFVFHGDYMFSQEGLGYLANSNKAYGSYEAFADPSTAITNWINNQYTTYSDVDWFMPYFVVNAKTGDFYGSKGSLDGMDISRGDVTIDSSGISMYSSGEPRVQIHNSTLSTAHTLGVGEMTVRKGKTLSGTTKYGLNGLTNGISAGTYEFGYFGSGSSFVLTSATVTATLSQYSGNNYVSTANTYLTIYCVNNGVRTDLYKGTIGCSGNSANKSPSFTQTINKTYTNVGYYYATVSITGCGVQNTDETVTGDVAGEPVSVLVSLSILCTPNRETKLLEIGNNGIRIYNTNGYFQMLENVFTAIIGNYGLRINDSGIQYTKDGGTNYITLIDSNGLKTS